MLVFKFGADLVTFNHAAGPSLLFLVLLFFMDSTRGGGGTEPRYRGGGALGGGWRVLSPVSRSLSPTSVSPLRACAAASQLYSHNTKCSISILFLFPALRAEK